MIAGATVSVSLHHSEPEPGWQDEVAGISRTAELYGLHLMPWQLRALQVATQHDGTRYRHHTIVLSTPRQAGKTTLLQALALHRLAAGSLGRPWHCYLLGQTRVDARRHLLAWAEGAARGRYPDVVVRRAMGQEELELDDNWARVGTLGPKALHGTTFCTLLWDEPWSVAALDGEEVMQAAGPAMLTRPDRQLWLVSTAGNEDSRFFRQWVERGRSGDTGVCHVEYGCPGGVDIDDLATWPTWHPGWGTLIDSSSVESLRQMFGADRAGFERAAGNRWPEHVQASGLIDPAVWAALAEPADQPAPGTVALGVDVDHAATSASLAVAWRDGPLIRVELADHRTGTLWLAPRIRELMTRWRIREVAGTDFGPAAAALAVLETARIPVRRLPGPECAAAVQAMLSAIGEATVRHTGQVLLDTAVEHAATRAYGEGVQWQRRGDIISPLAAASWAAWQAGKAQPAVRPRIVLAS